MTIDYPEKGKVKISMQEYINKLLDELLHDMDGIVNDSTKKLTLEKLQLFHHVVTKLLYLCRRTSQEIQTAVAFLCTRDKSPNRMTTRN